jgi:hypothetical protein
MSSLCQAPVELQALFAGFYPILLREIPGKIAEQTPLAGMLRIVQNPRMFVALSPLVTGIRTTRRRDPVGNRHTSHR